VGLGDPCTVLSVLFFVNYGILLVLFFVNYAGLLVCILYFCHVIDLNGVMINVYTKKNRC
jgi:hypothetical protein